jgi:4-hydroxy-tetrahydrodipicolinate reductase
MSSKASLWRPGPRRRDERQNLMSTLAAGIACDNAGAGLRVDISPRRGVAAGEAKGIGMATDDILRIGVAGALGRMGHAVAEVLHAWRGLDITARFDQPEATGDATLPALTSCEAALGLCDVIIDFSSAAASVVLAQRAAARGGPALVIGSTGFSAQEDAIIARAAGKIPIVKSGNFSIGVNVLAGLVEQTASRLGGEDWDIEVFEAHHRGKRDAPSGTGLLLGEAAARGRGKGLAQLRAHTREGAAGERPPGAIGFSVMRGGGIVGEHSVVFAAADEIVTLSHSARDRRLFARGAVEAAVWVAGRAPGLYDMVDVLGLRG